MQGELNLLVAFAAFIGACVALVGCGLVVLSFGLRARTRHRNRLARVGRRRLSGQIDLDETRLHALRRREEAGPLVRLSAALSRFIPVLDSARLEASIRRGGLKLSIASFVLIAMLLASLFSTAAIFGLGLPPLLVIVPALFAGMIVTDAFVKLRGEMMSERFMKQLPSALDAIIRGIRAGLPVVECIATVGKDEADPIGGHFRAIAERVHLGEPLDVALWRTAETIDRAETDFLAICISIQMETGGSLGEALGNLATLLREREKMKLKIRAISSEARASAMIIGALPFVMLFLLTLVNRDYVMPLFVDPRGQFMLLLGLISIGIGAAIMWRMTRFEI